MAGWNSCQCSDRSLGLDLKSIYPEFNDNWNLVRLSLKNILILKKAHHMRLQYSIQDKRIRTRALTHDKLRTFHISE